jgi:hypothetical protein
MFTTLDNIFGIVKENLLVKYPSDPRYDFINVSFPLNWEGGTIEGVKYVKLTKTDKPNGKLGWVVVDIYPIYNANDDILLQTWQLQYIGNIKLKTLISKKRYDIETNGLMIDDNYYKTDRESQTKYSIMALNKIKTYWKIDEFNFVYSDMKIIDKKVREFVQACFETERKFFEIIDSDDLELIANTDFETGWPSNT